MSLGGVEKVVKRKVIERMYGNTEKEMFWLKIGWEKEFAQKSTTPPPSDTHTWTAPYIHMVEATNIQTLADSLIAVLIVKYILRLNLLITKKPKVPKGSPLGNLVSYLNCRSHSARLPVARVQSGVPYDVWRRIPTRQFMTASAKSVGHNQCRNV